MLRKRANSLTLQYESVVDDPLACRNAGELRPHRAPVAARVHYRAAGLALSAQCPAQLLKVNEAASAVIDVTLWLESAQAHLAIVAGAHSSAALSALPLVVEPLCAVGSLEQNLRLDRPLPLAHLADRKLAIPTRPNSIRAICDRAFAEAGLLPNICLEVNSKQLAMDLAESGSVTAVLPYSAAYFAVADGRLSAAPVVGMVIEWCLVRSRTATSRASANGWRRLQPRSRHRGSPRAAGAPPTCRRRTEGFHGMPARYALHDIRHFLAAPAPR